MKKRMRWGYTVMLAFAGMLTFGIRADAEGADVIKQGIFAEGIDLSGMTAEAAAEAVEAYVEELKTTEITLVAAAGTEVAVTAEELWSGKTENSVWWEDRSVMRWMWRLPWTGSVNS